MRTGWSADLRRTVLSRRASGATTATGGGAARRSGRPVPRRDRPAWWWRPWPSSRPAAPTSPSIPHTPTIGCDGCSTTPARASWSATPVRPTGSGRREIAPPSWWLGVASCKTIRSRTAGRRGPGRHSRPISPMSCTPRGRPGGRRAWWSSTPAWPTWSNGTGTPSRLSAERPVHPDRQPRIRRLGLGDLALSGLRSLPPRRPRGVAWRSRRAAGLAGGRSASPSPSCRRRWPKRSWAWPGRTTVPSAIC